MRELLPTSAYVVRTAWLYRAHGSNFVRTMMRLEREPPTLDVVDDQHGQPTWTMDVVSQVIMLAHSQAPAGVYHATSSGETTWFGLACESSACSVPTQDGSGRSAATPIRARHPGPPTASLVTASGQRLA